MPERHDWNKTAHRPIFLPLCECTFSLLELLGSARSLVSSGAAETKVSGSSPAPVPSSPLPQDYTLPPSPPPRLPACWKISYNWFIWDLHWLFVPLGKTWSRETERSHLTMSAEVLLTSGSRLKSFPYCFPHLPSENSSPDSSSPPAEALLVQVSRA